MTKLIHSVEGVVVSEFALNKELVTIGRKAQNDIQVESQTASSEHARIVTLGNDSFLEDLGSTNGTLVNGKPIKKHFLQNNDLIEIGSHRFQFVSDVSGADRLVDSNIEKTILLRAPKSVARTLPLSPPPPQQQQQQGLFAKLKSWFKSLLSG